MDVKCFETKIIENKLKNNQYNKLKEIYKQAKYLANDIIGSDDIFAYDTKIKQVKVQWTDKDGVEQSEFRTIEDLNAQVKQSILTGIITDICNLAKAKKKGLKIGKLKFKKEIVLLNFKQYKGNWYIKSGNNQLHLAGLGKIKVSGLDQLPKNVTEFGPAKLIRKPSGYYVQITCYSNKPELPQIKEEINSTNIIGIDMGIKDHIVLSNGEKYNFNYDIKKIQKSHQELSRKVKGSKNRYKQLWRLKKKYEELMNKKVNDTNQFVSDLTKRFKLICVQDENIRGWKSGLFGKQVHGSILGRIKSKLNKLSTTLIVPMNKPTTKLCPKCEKLNILSLSDRTYECSCGFKEDRDIKSARTIVCMALNNYVPTERREFTPVEILTSGLTDKYELLFSEAKLELLKQEAHESLAHG